MTTICETNHREAYETRSARMSQREATARGDARDCALAMMMKHAQDGDRASYSVLLKEVTRILQRVLQRKLSFLPAADREDLLQDILLSLHVARSTFDPGRPFIPWLMAIAHNRIVDNVRRNSRRVANEVLVDEYPATIVDDTAVMPLDGYGDPEALHGAVKALPKGQRTAIELLKFRELSLKEASETSGMSVTALKVSAHRAIKALRSVLAS